MVRCLVITLVGVSDLWDDVGGDPDESSDDESPICRYCGVSALPPEVPGDQSSCENPDCDAFGEPVEGSGPAHPD